MPYQINRYASDLLWVTMHGQMALPHAEAYFREMWQTLDCCPQRTDLLVDGRSIASASHSARQRTEQIVHHPNLGQIAFVVRTQHLLLFAPLMKLVSGIGLFGSEHEAIEYLRGAHGQAIGLPNSALPPHPRPVADRRAPRPANGLTGIVDGWTSELRNLARRIEGD